MLQGLDLLLRNASAIALDLDGVVVDTEPLRQEAWRIALCEIGLCREVPLALVGRLDEEIASVITASPDDAECLLHCERQALRGLLNGQPPPLVAGVGDFIAAARGRSVVLALASNSSLERVVEILDHYRLTPCFEVVAAARGRFVPKPSPDIYRHVIDALRMPPSAILAIEDSLVGVQAAQAAGLKVIAMSADSSRLLAPVADAVASGFPVLLEQLRGGRP